MRVDWKFYVFICFIAFFGIVVNLGVFRFAPREAVILHSTYTSFIPFVYNMYTMNFAHFNYTHMYTNLSGFVILLLFLVLYEGFIYSVGGERRSDIFYLFALSAFTVLPLVVAFNEIILWIFQGIPTGYAACGFSAIVFAFFGYCSYSVCRVVKLIDVTINRRFRAWTGFAFKVTFLLVMVSISLGWLSDSLNIGLGPANAHLAGFVFGFGLYWLMDRSGNRDISPWLPRIFWNTKDWL